MKKIGIICDNYKVKKFEKALLEYGLSDYGVAPYKHETTIITIYCYEDRVNDIANICTHLELEFNLNKQINN